MKCAIFGLVTLILGASATIAQDASDFFRGTWQIETPNDGALILILKRGSLASYFWGDNTDRTVYQGSWSQTEDTATLIWGDGTQHRIVRDALGFGISYIDSQQNMVYTVPAQQVPKEILGQWAKPPNVDNRLASAQDKAKGYFATWKVGKDGEENYLIVEPDRSAATNIGGERGLRGSWAKQGSELHIAWDNGEYSILRENERSYSFKQVKSGVVIEEDETEFTSAERTQNESVPSSWLSSYQTERELNSGGIAFSSRKNARAFYRGAWLVRVSDDKFERVEIGRFGGLSSSVDRSLQGSWRMQGQDIFMRWDNGMRRILSPVGDGFVLYDYKPGRPLDGVPTRIFAAAPEDRSKFSEHLKGREDVARQMLELAEAAGIDTQEQKAGWGRTFARWAWPFDGESDDASTSAIIQEGYEETKSTDPWWWPFWSEEMDTNATTQPTETAESATEVIEEVKTQEAPLAIVTEVAEEASEEEEEPKKKTKKSAKDWVWPF
ncbi:MAG TPA: hypothetical protein DCX06_12450 [Opitutae bacterium]|nr:hypothetical protein [Opitutae bacterium]